MMSLEIKIQLCCPSLLLFYIAPSGTFIVVSLNEDSKLRDSKCGRSVVGDLRTLVH